MTTEPHVVKILPSLILYNNYDNDSFDDVRVNNTIRQNRTPNLDEFCQRVLEKGEYPRLQVVERNRCLYTINNTRLALFQRLEESGYCAKVRVEVVPLKTIPPGLRDVLCPQDHVTSRMMSYWGKLVRGYKLVGLSSDRRSSHTVADVEEGDDDDGDNDGDNDGDDDGGGGCGVDEVCKGGGRNKSLEGYQNKYEETLIDSSSDEDDDDEEDDDDGDESNGDDSDDENRHLYQWQNSFRLESSGLIDGRELDARTT